MMLCQQRYRDSGLVQWNFIVDGLQFDFSFDFNSEIAFAKRRNSFGFVDAGRPKEALRNRFTQRDRRERGAAAVFTGRRRRGMRRRF